MHAGSRPRRSRAENAMASAAAQGRRRGAHDVRRASTADRRTIQRATLTTTTATASAAAGLTCARYLPPLSPTPPRTAAAKAASIGAATAAATSRPPPQHLPARAGERRRPRGHADERAPGDGVIQRDRDHRPERDGRVVAAAASVQREARVLDPLERRHGERRRRAHRPRQRGPQHAPARRARREERHQHHRRPRRSAARVAIGHDRHQEPEHQRRQEARSLHGRQGGKEEHRTEEGERRRVVDGLPRRRHPAQHHQEDGGGRGPDRAASEAKARQRHQGHAERVEALQQEVHAVESDAEGEQQAAQVEPAPGDEEAVDGRRLPQQRARPREHAAPHLALIVERVQPQRRRGPGPGVDRPQRGQEDRRQRGPGRGGRGASPRAMVHAKRALRAPPTGRAGVLDRRPHAGPARRAADRHLCRPRRPG